METTEHTFQVLQNISEMNTTQLGNRSNSLLISYSSHSDILWEPLIFVGILILIGIPGNLLILAVYGLKNKPSVNRTIILTLAFYDLLVSSITLPFEFYDLYVRFEFPAHAEWACKIFRTFNYFFVFNSSSVIQLMTFERFRRVCRPLKRQMTPRIVFIAIIIICVASLLVTIPNIFIRGFQTKYLRNNVTGYDCSVSVDFVNSSFLVYYNGGLLFTCVCNIFCVIIQYMFIGRQIYKHFRFIKNLKSKYKNQFCDLSRSTNFSSIPKEIHLDNKMSDVDTKVKTCNLTVGSATTVRASYKSTKIAVMISIFFILSYCPTLLESILEGIVGESRIINFLSPSIKNIIERAFAINHVINPFIYGFIDRKFRQDCGAILNSVFKGCAYRQ